MNGKLQRERLRVGLLVGFVAVVAVVWIGQQTPSGQENPFTGTSFRIDAGDVRVSSRGFEAGARTH